MGVILDFLLPREKKFISMLMAQSATLMSSAEEFNSFITNFNNFDKQDMIEKTNEIKEIEHKGDRIMRDIIDGLNETFITPLDREDIFSLAQGMEEAIDFMYETNSKILMYNVKKLPKEMASFSKGILECCSIIKKSMHYLRNYKEIKKSIVIVHGIEKELDRLFYKCIKDLFENNADAKEIIKFKDIYSSVEEAMNMCKKVADTMGQVVVKHG